MAITAQDVSALRARTGASMMACKRALEEANGDAEKAIEIMLKKGETKAAEKADRTAGEGVIAISSAGNKAALVKINCETDFVARNDEFVAFARKIADIALAKGADAAKAEADAGLKALFTKLGENLVLSAIDIVEGPVVGAYVHGNNKIGVIVTLDAGTEEQAKDVAMHAAAMSPSVVSPSQVTDESVAKQKEIWTEQLAKENKPANVMENIMKGKEKKFREENALMTQNFVKNPDMTVEAYLNGSKVTEFLRVAI